MRKNVHYPNVTDWFCACAHFSALGGNQSSSHLSHTGAEILLSTARLPQLHSITDYRFVGSLCWNYHLIKSQVPMPVSAVRCCYEQLDPMLRTYGCNVVVITSTVRLGVGLFLCHQGYAIAAGCISTKLGGGMWFGSFSILVQIWIRGQILEIYIFFGELSLTLWVRAFSQISNSWKLMKESRTFREVICVCAI